MLICIRYQHFTDRKDEEFDFDECSQLKTTIEKNRKKEVNFQNKCVSSQKIRMRKEEGATVAATYLLSGETVRAGLVRAGQAAILHRDIQLYRKPP